MTFSKLRATGSALALVILLAPAEAMPQSAEVARTIAQVSRDVPGSIVSQLSQPKKLEDLMAAQKIPAVSVAVFLDGTLTFAHAWGTTDTTSGTPATVATLFQAASISKPVAAIGAITFVRENTLSLDADISKSVTGWQAARPITLRQLLSHTAGLGVSGFNGYQSGLPLPTTLQIINGQTPANSRAVLIEVQPGTAFNYSGGGYTVLQALLEQTANKSFPHLMQDRVLSFLGMNESQFSQPLPANDMLRAARGHQNGAVIAGGANIYPELAAAGLWTTPRDLGKVAVAVQNALQGKSEGVVTPELAREMLTPQIGGYGLGFGLVRLNETPFFFHRGLNEGFETYLIASAAPIGPSYAIVIMTNGQGGSDLASGLVRAIAREYGWTQLAPRRVIEVAPNARTLAALEGVYQDGNNKMALEVLNGVLHVRDGNWQRAPMIPIQGTADEQKFAVENRTFDILLPNPQRPGMPRLLKYNDGTTSIVLTRSERPFKDLVDQPPLLRGSMNNWGSEAVFVKSAPTKWTLTTTLPAGTHEFKIATANWSSLNLGGALGSVPMPLGQPVRLAPMGDNLTLNLTQTSEVRFEIDAWDGRRATLKVSLARR